MPKVSSKRQITLPVASCDELGIHPGDEIEVLRYRNQLNIIKKEVGSAAGILKGVKVNKRITDEESMKGHFG